MWLEPVSGRAMPNQNSCRYFLPIRRPPAQLTELQLSARIIRGGKSEPVTIHPDDAQARGIQDGDMFGCGTHAGKFLPERSLARE